MSSGEKVSIPDGVRHIHLDGNPLIGRMRNVGCDAAHGEVIAHFDDDDFSHPGRLTDQLLRLEKAQVTGYHSMRFTDGIKWWLYSGSSSYALGTSLVYRRSWWAQHHFTEPQGNIGEDNTFVEKSRRVLTTAPAGEMQWATIHSTNTSRRNLDGASWKPLEAN